MNRPSVELRPIRQLVLETYSCQAVTPRDADTVDYYYSIGPSRTIDLPGLSELLLEAMEAAFLEDKAMLEAQYQRMKEKPDRPVLGIIHDAGPAKMLRVLDELLQKEAQQQLVSEGAHANQSEKKQSVLGVDR